MAPWTERLPALAFVLVAGAQVGAPGGLFAPDEVRRAVLLEDADFFSSPSSDGDIVARFPTGAILDYVGESTDDFGRTWFTVRHPERYQRRRDVYLTNLDQRQLADLGYRAAILADRQPVFAAPRPTGQPTQPPPPWWAPVAVLEPGRDTTFVDVVAIGARAPRESDLLEAIDLLGGREAIATWPTDPLPGELFVPAMIPALFQFDGAEWRPARPVRLLDDSISLLGNPTFAIDPRAPIFAAGPALHCWSLVDSLDPAGALAGGVEVAPPLVPTPGGIQQVGATGGVVPPLVGSLLAPLLPMMLVPPRVDPLETPAGVLLQDLHSQQAVYLEQTLGSVSTARLRGKSLALDLLTRNPPGATAAATIGIDVEVRFADGRTPEHLTTSFPSSNIASRVEFPFDVPIDAETITVRLLAADRSVAVEQRGSVIFERASLRLARWAAEPVASSVVLNRISVNAFEGASLYTRAPIAVTARPVVAIEQIWPGVVAADWPSEDKRLVLAGEIRNGMREQQVRSSWGNPLEQTTSDTGENHRRWDYADRYVVFADGGVIAFSPPRREVEDEAGSAPMCPGAPTPSPTDAGR